jgi:hypothetical protein
MLLFPDIELGIVEFIEILDLDLTERRRGRNKVFFATEYFIHVIPKSWSNDSCGHRRLLVGN